jgi:CopG family transcriptional regulator, nickel-responsive regulator
MAKARRPRISGYLSEQQRSQRGPIARRMQPDFRHGLLEGDSLVGRSMLQRQRTRLHAFSLRATKKSLMSTVSRFGVSLEEDLLAAFDLSIGGQGYQNRSEAIRDLIRDHLIQKRVVQGDAEVIGVVTLVYDHRVHRLSDVLADMQHKAEVVVNASLHIHLDEHNCLEVIVIRGRGNKVHEIAGKLIATKGVQNGKLVTTSPELQH